ncbi:YqjF family protein [Mycolicibacterium vaccae]|uniref:YqjF family protein n=1 Tax=Mycolicibacterium vaccae TaxID=1810 RepID=UPI003CFC9B1A
MDLPPLPLPVLLTQHWADVTFVHWPVDPDAVAHHFPPGTRPDVSDDGTYVGLIPLVVGRSTVGEKLPLGYLGSFAETNVRLYSVDDAGRHGVLFRSLETQRSAVVPLTRIGLGVPYTWAKMRVDRPGGQISYTSVRRWPGRGVRSHLTVDVGSPVDPTPLEVWLTARWGAHTRKAGRSWWVPITHPMWPLHTARVAELSDELVAAAGIGATGERLRALYSPGVPVRFGRPAAIG